MYHLKWNSQKLCGFGCWLLMCSNFVVCAPVDSSPVENSPWAFSPEVEELELGPKDGVEASMLLLLQPASQHIFQYSVSQRKWHGTSHISGKKKFGLYAEPALKQQRCCCLLFGGEAYLLTVKFPYSQVPHLLQFQIRLQYLLPNIDSGYNISYHFLFYKAERNHNGSKPWARILLGSRAELG